MRTRVAVAVMTVLLLLYVVLAGQRALVLLSSGEPVGIAMGVALLVLPLLALWAICVVVCAWVARARVTAASAGPIGVALAGPLLVCFLLPDAVVYATSGFAALGRVVRVTGPLTFVVTVALVAVAVRATHGVSTARAWASAAAGVIVQALAGAPLLR